MRNWVIHRVESRIRIWLMILKRRRRMKNLWAGGKTWTRWRGTRVHSLGANRSVILVERIRKKSSTFPGSEPQPHSLLQVYLGPWEIFVLCKRPFHSDYVISVCHEDGDVIGERSRYEAWFRAGTDISLRSWAFGAWSPKREHREEETMGSSAEMTGRSPPPLHAYPSESSLGLILLFHPPVLTLVEV